MELKTLKRMAGTVSTEERLATIEANQVTEKDILNRIELALVDIRSSQNQFITRHEYMEKEKHTEGLEKTAVALQKEIDGLKATFSNQVLIAQNQVNTLTLDCKQDIYNVNLRVAYYSGGIAVLAVVAKFLMNKYL